MKVDNLKRCYQCKQRKPIRDFETKRHKICHACRVALRLPELEGYMAGYYLGAEAREHQREHAIPALTSTYQGALKYQRERRRLAAEDTPRKNKPTGKPRTCRHCKRVLGAWAFRDDRVRICTRCDGPDMRDPRDVKRSRPS